MGFKEPNYTQIPNELIDCWMDKLTGAEFKAMMFICRKTFGFHKTRDRISGSQIAKGCGLSRRAAVDTLKGLIRLNLIAVTHENGSTNTIELVIDYEQKVHTQEVEPVQSVHTPCANTSQVPVQILHTQKKSYKENLNKNTICCEDSQNVLQYLNTKAGRNYQKVNAHTTARLKEYSKEDLMAVIDWKVCEWAGGDMAKYLTQETLFSVKHFDTYLDDARRNLAGVEKKAYDKYCEEFYQAHMSLPLEERRGKRPLTIEEWKVGK